MAEIANTRFDTAALASAFDSTVADALAVGQSADPAHAAWNRAVAKFVRCAALAEADKVFGAYSMSDCDFEALKSDLEYEFGKNYQAIPEAKARHDEGFKLIVAAEERRIKEVLSPLWEAEKELAMTPAPTLKAVLFKIEFIRRHDLWQDLAFPEPAMAGIVDDLARLTEGGA